jgi:hypothetical protein
MAINIKVSQPKREVIRITVDEHDKPDASIKMDLKARRTLDGNVLIFDHKDIDIVLMPEKKKIVTFAKNILGDDVYEAQNRLFSYLFKKGIVSMDSVQGGNVYSSMEAKILESKDHNATQVALFSIGKFIESEKPYIEFEKAFEKAEEERLSDPGPEESTEFDADRHDSQKGSLRPGMKPYGIASVYRI